MDERQKKNLKDAASYQTLYDLLAELNLEALSASEIHFINRQLNKLAPAPDVKIAFLGNCTVDPLPAYLNVHAAFEGLIVRDFVGKYDQYYQEILHGDLKAFDPQVLHLALSMKRLAPDVDGSFCSLSNTSKSNKIDEILNHIASWIQLALKNTQAILLVQNFPSPAHYSAGIGDSKQDFGEGEFYAELNLRLLRLVKPESRVHVFDLEKLISQYGKHRAFDSKMYYLAKREWTEGFLYPFAEELTRYLKAISGRTKKCLILDCDQTIWGGIVGEEGPHGIRVGIGDPVGEAYLNFQQRVQGLKHRGIILAICSKNNHKDVVEVFDQRPEMPLRLSDFSAIEVNWNDKHENIRRIAQSLSLGTDALVFVDDSPRECALVRRMLPEVKTYQLPEDPSQYASFLDRITDFERLLFTVEDERKTEQYAENQKRMALREEIGDLRSYLEELKTEIEIRPASSNDLPRIQQLFIKTNQFNLTTVRYTLAQLEDFFRSGNHSMLVIEARDVFGNLGKIGVYLLELNEFTVRIDSFILSCRAMGRGIEAAMMNHIKTSGCRQTLEATYVPTAKNLATKTFYDEQGFQCIQIAPDGTKHYRLLHDRANLVDSSWIRVLESARGVSL